MKFVRQLFESRPFHIPDQSIILSSAGTADDRVQAARATDNSYWIIYITNGHSVDLDLSESFGLVNECMVVQSTRRAYLYHPIGGRQETFRYLPK